MGFICFSMLHDGFKMHTYVSCVLRHGNELSFLGVYPMAINFLIGLLLIWYCIAPILLAKKTILKNKKLPIRLKLFILFPLVNLLALAIYMAVLLRNMSVNSFEYESIVFRTILLLHLFSVLSVLYVLYFVLRLIPFKG